MPEVFNAVFFTLLLRFALTLGFNAIQMRIVTKHSADSKQNIYSFFIISVVVFFLAHTLSAFEMKLGMAIGMFAVFGIVRYRTETLKPQEMTYLFSAIGIAVINALFSSGRGVLELLMINVIVLVLVYVLERFLIKDSKEIDEKLKKITLVVAASELDQQSINTKVKTLENDLGLTFKYHHVLKVDHTQNTAQLNLFYEAI